MIFSKKRHLNRRMVLSALVAKESGSDIFLDPDGVKHIPEQVLEGAKEILEGINTFQKEIDKIISSCLHKHSLNNLGLIEKSVLRLATYELFYLHDTPVRVVLNEGVILTKKFAGEKAAKFVNGVLRGIYNASKEVNQVNN